MTVLIKQASIISPSSPFDGTTKDILIENGIITRIGKVPEREPGDTINQEGLCVSPGWMDPFTHCCDPGFEFRETLESAAAAAAAGGFTDILALPNTNPVIHNKSQVEYIVQKGNALPVNILPLGAVTKNTDGLELAELYDMRNSGAVAFSDGINSIQSPGILLKALQYVKAFGGLIIQLPEDKSIGAHGLMNEGIISTQLGLPGKPAIAEELMIARDIELLRYTGSRLHITGVSTAKGIELISKAKKEGLDISCSVTPYHVIFCDEDLQGYDTNLKVNPPLRTRTDMQALQQALLNGAIDCIASHHLPQHLDNKDCEFEYAKDGMIGLQTVFPAMMSIGMKPEQFVQLSLNARKIFGLPIPVIAEGASACLSLFDPKGTNNFETTSIRSKSRNSAFIGKLLKGSVTGIINKNSQVLNQAPVNA